MAFDPDQFLQETHPQATASANEFNPDEFLNSTSSAPSLGARAIDVLKNNAPAIARGIGYVANPASAALDAVRWEAMNPEKAYERTGKYLPMVGGVAGSFAAPGIGTAVGAGAGEMARQGLGVLFQDPNVMSHITPGQISPWAGEQAALQTGLSGLNEVNGLVKAAPGAAPYAQRVIDAAAQKLAPVGKRLVDAWAATGQMLSGKPAAKIKMLFNDPTATFPEALGGAKSVEAAGQGMEAALAKEGIEKKIFNPFEGNDDEAAQIGKQTFDKWKALQNGTAQPADLPVVDLNVAKNSENPVALFVGNQDLGNGPKALYTIYQKGQALGSRSTLDFEQLPAGVKIIGKEPRAAGQVPVGGDLPTISAQEAYDAKRATDYVFPKVVSERNAEKIAQLTQFKQAMDDVLSNQAGTLQQASKDYARARLGADFTQILPRTKTGDISTVKTFLAALVDGKRAALLPFTSPLAVGAATSGASLMSRALGTAIANPTARQALISRYITSTSTGNSGN